MYGRVRFPRLGVLAALLALAAQLAVGATVPRPLAGFGFGVICHTDAPTDPPGQHAPIPPRCPLCAALATPAPLLAGTPVIAVPARVFFPFARPTPPATGPPPRIVYAAQPRGPPPLA